MQTLANSTVAGIPQWPVLPRSPLTILQVHIFGWPVMRKESFIHLGTQHIMLKKITPPAVNSATRLLTTQSLNHFPVGH
jgi:hypothetical protein